MDKQMNKFIDEQTDTDRMHLYVIKAYIKLNYHFLFYF